MTPTHWFTTHAGGWVNSRLLKARPAAASPLPPRECPFHWAVDATDVARGMARCGGCHSLAPVVRVDGLWVIAPHPLVVSESREAGS